MSNLANTGRFLQSHENGTVEFKGYNSRGYTEWVSQERLTPEELYAMAAELIATARAMEHITPADVAYADSMFTD